VWERTVDGRTLTFRLIGINNQNFLMEDRETGSWWQQITGKAILGPLKGGQLTSVLHDEVTFGLWRREHPQGRVLALDARQSQIKPDWETRVDKAPVVTPPREGDPIEPRTLMVGIVVNGQARAYPRVLLDRQSRVLQDELGGTPLAIVTGADGQSVRAFARDLDGKVLELLDRVGSSPARFIDAQTGSEWDISGRALAGPLAGSQLRRVPLVSDYWFDWRTHNPKTTVYKEWAPKRKQLGGRSKEEGRAAPGALLGPSPLSLVACSLYSP
jgi:hypothetical protein